MAPYKCLSNITSLLCHHLQPSSCQISAVGMVFSFSSFVNLSQVLYMTAREIFINRKPILPFPCLNPAVPLLNTQLKTKGRGGTQTLVIRSCSLLRTTAPLPPEPSSLPPANWASSPDPPAQRHLAQVFSSECSCVLGP